MFWHYNNVIKFLSGCSLTCQNNGTLNAETCQCDCAQSWSGSECSGIVIQKLQSN